VSDHALIPLCWVWDDPASELCMTWDQLAQAAGADGHTGDADAEVAHGVHPASRWWLNYRRERWQHEAQVRG
jgi:hypothetical protein